MTRLIAVLALAVLALAVLLVPRASAQTGAPAEGSASGPDLAVQACTYDACALRIEPRLFSGPAILRGRDALPAGRIGLFSDDLSQIVSGNKVAYGYARDAESAQGVSFGLALAGTALLVYASTYYQIDRVFDETGFRSDNSGGTLAALIGGATLTVAGGVLQVRSQQARSRAVWEYNRGLAALAP